MMLSVSMAHSFGAFSLDVEFCAPPGLTVLFGRSGSGKTSIINAVAGLLRPDHARISLGDKVLVDTARGTCLAPQSRQVGYIFQDARLFPHLNVRQNLRYGRLFTKRRLPENEVARIVAMLGLEPLLTRRPGTLSGGERQRVAIGRALISAPRLILADEPLAALDAARKAEILPYFERIRDETDIPILYVSHAAAEVARLATSIVALETGRVVRQGTAIDVLGDPMVTPAGARAAGAVIEARIARHHSDGLTEILAGGGATLFLPRVALAEGALLRVRIAASEVILARVAPVGTSAQNILAGVVEQVRSGEGPGAIVSLSTKAGPVLARVTMRSVQSLGLQPGVSCHAMFKSVAIAPEDVGA